MMAAAGYALMRGVHIRADFMYRNWSAEDAGDGRCDHDVPGVLFPGDAAVFLDVARVLHGWDANARNGDADNGWERLSDTAWAPSLQRRRAWPCPLGAFLLLLARPSQSCSGPFHQMGKERERTFLRILPFYFSASQLSSPVCSMKRSAGWRLVVFDHRQYRPD